VAGLGWYSCSRLKLCCAVCWSFGVVGLEWYPCSRLKHQLMFFFHFLCAQNVSDINPLTPNDPYRGRTAPLTSKRCISYIYSTNTSTEYFERGVYSPFFFSSKCSLFHNSNEFSSCIIHILYTGVLKLKT